MDAQVLFAGVAITDLDAVRPWYEHLFGRPADIIPNENEVMWRAAADAGWLYVVVDEERAGRSLVALSVADLDAELAALREPWHRARNGRAGRETRPEGHPARPRREHGRPH